MYPRFKRGTIELCSAAVLSNTCLFSEIKHCLGLYSPVGVTEKEGKEVSFFVNWLITNVNIFVRRAYLKR